MSYSTSADLIPFLNKLRTRVPLSSNERDAVLSLPHTVRALRRHEYIVRTDETPHYCCVLTSGFAVRHKTAGNGGRQIFSIHMRGDPVDLHNSLLRRADHDVQMLSAGEAAFIPVEAIRELTLAYPVIGNEMWYETLVDAAIFREWTLNVGRRDARSRMAHMLCEFAFRLELASLGATAEYNLPMTQEELADALAITPIHVNRTFKSLESEGYVTRNKRLIKIVGWHRLAKVGDFDSAYLHIPES